MTLLQTVYNRGFWSGYYLGQKLGEWSPANGSMATQKKIYIGKGKHFFPKTSIGQFVIEAYDLKIGDKILVTGPTTGAKEMDVNSMMVNDVEKDNATKGDEITLPVAFRIRPSDKLYKLVKTEYAES